MDAEQRTRDAWLALKCQAAEPGALEALIAEFERPLFSYLLHMVRQPDQAGELLQETWMRALRTISKLKDPGALRAWLYTVAHGITVDQIRRDRVRQRAEERYWDEGETNTSPDLSSLTAADVREAITRLPSDQREVLVLHFLEDFPIADIAHIVGCPPGTVKSRLHRAKAQLKQLL